MTLYKVHFTAGLTEMEAEVRPRPGMQRQVGDGSDPVPNPVPRSHPWSVWGHLCSVLASLLKLSAARGGVSAR